MSAVVEFRAWRADPSQRSSEAWHFTGWPYAPGVNPRSPLSRPWLLADIGGTNARFGWLAAGSETPSHIETLPVAQFDGPVAAAQSYLAQLAALQGDRHVAPRAGAFAVASAVGPDRVELINSGWSFSRAQTRAALGLDELLLLNDFEALALSLPRLTEAQLRRWPGGQALAGAALAVIGPGTGLGVASLMPTRHGYVAIAGEGGHATLAPTDAFEASVLAAAQREFAHVSAERLLSGIGLPVLHRAVAAVLGQARPELTTSQIVDRGLAGDDMACVRTLDSFCAVSVPSGSATTSARSWIVPVLSAV